MDIPIKVKDKHNIESNIMLKFNLPEFIKHFGFAGMGNYPSHLNLIKGIGAVLYFNNFVNYSNVTIDDFRKSRNNIYDPTEKAQFSNLLGKSIADFASKKINNAKISINYEAAMKIAGYKIKGSRPDLYCTDSKSEQFAIECKGFSAGNVSDNEMKKHKKQSKTGPLKIDYSIASVTYCIYWNLKVKYYDPIINDFPYNEELNSIIIKKYYKGIKEILNNSQSIDQMTLEDERFDMIYLNEIFDKKIFLLVTKKINQYIETGSITDNFSQLNNQQEDIYIDLDGIGIYLR